MRRPRLSVEINWGLPLYIFAGIILLLLISSISLMIIYKLQIILAIFILPILILNILLLPIHKSMIYHLLKKKDPVFVIYKEGITIRGRHFLWDKIRSISFDTGIIRVDTAFRGFKLPYLQRIYIDEKGEIEHSCIIDIDYSLKADRTENNLNIIRDELVDMGKANIISDWAERY
jgi:hypothetical protein